MPLQDKVVLTGILFIFAAFAVLMLTVCWLDAREDRIQRRRELSAGGAQQPAMAHHPAAVHS